MKCPNDQETRFSEVLELEEPFGPCLLFRDEHSSSKSRGSWWETLLAPQAQTSSHLKCTAVVTLGGEGALRGAGALWGVLLN